MPPKNSKNGKPKSLLKRLFSSSRAATTVEERNAAPASSDNSAPASQEAELQEQERQRLQQKNDVIREQARSGKKEDMEQVVAFNGKNENEVLGIKADATSTAVVSDKSAGRVLLPSNVVASHYDLTITPNMSGDFKYKGHVTINLELKDENLKEITLHSHELELFSAKVKSGPVEETTTKFEYDEKLHTVAIKFDQALSLGECELYIEFSGYHNNQMAGFYRSSYNNAQGDSCIMVSTQFESLSARRCFPCIDEPAAKATFTTSLIVESYLTALSNMPESACEYIGDGKYKKVSYMPTPKMSTYLLAFVVGEFDYCSTITEHGVVIRVYTPPAKCHLGRFALDAGKKCLDFYDETFGVPFPLPKLDMVAIPEFAAGAMENWGLVTYREVELLIDDLRASSQQKQRVCTVVTHELAHQWFGNLVTMNWWDDLWLNEGFAAWTQVYAAAHIFPEWSMWEQFVIHEQPTALALDSLASSHPIQVPIKHAEEVEEVFDGISYAKGSCVVRMIFAYLGEQKFVEGLRLYMQRHQYSNTETSDLWAAWTEVSGNDVGALMKSWTEQMGYPVVTVQNTTFANGKATLDLEQEWFLSDGSKPEGFEGKKWSIPLIVTVNGKDSTIPVVMTEIKQSITIDAPKGAWIKLNAGQHVPMRVAYRTEDMPAFASAISSKQMGVEDRAGMVLDAAALVKAGRMDAGDLVTLLAAYKNEDTMPVWTAVSTALSGVSRVLVDNETLSKQFQKFAGNLIADASKKVGWDPKPDDGHLGTLLRATMVKLQESYLLEDHDVQVEAARRFDIFFADPKSEAAVLALPTDLKQAVFRIVLEKGADPATRYAQLRELLEKAETIAEQKDVYLAIGATPSKETKLKILEWCTSGEVKLQDFFYPIASVAASGKEGRDLTLQYVKDNYDRIYAMVEKASPSLMSAVVTYGCSGFNTVEKADELEKFFNEHSIPSIQRRVNQIVEGTRANAAFRERVVGSEAFKAALSA